MDGSRLLAEGVGASTTGDDGGGELTGLRRQPESIITMALRASAVRSALNFGRRADSMDRLVICSGNSPHSGRRGERGAVPDGLV